MKKVSKLFCICAFVFFISITGVATVFSVKYDYSFYENRNLAQLPRFSKESFISGEYFEGLGKYLEDQCEAREVLMKINTFVNMKILKRPVVNDIVVKDDILLPFNNFEVVFTRRQNTNFTFFFCVTKSASDKTPVKSDKDESSCKLNKTIP